MNYKELLLQAYQEATKSPDPSTQNGALLLRDTGIWEADCNRFPDGVEYTPERWERPIKYEFIEHAERNVIFKAAKEGIKTDGLIMVCCWSACTDCARAIIQAGIKTLVRHKQASDKAVERVNDVFKDEYAIADMMFKEAGVEVIDYNGFIGAPEVRFFGKYWKP
jgi:dCMP deaminase